MKLEELGSFEVAHGHLAWPWIAIDTTSSRFAYAASERSVASRALQGGRLVEGTTFALPEDLALPSAKPDPEGKLPQQGLHGFAIDGAGDLLAAIGNVSASAGASVIVTLDAKGEVKRSSLDTLDGLQGGSALTGGGLTARAVAFDRSGTRLWISAENATETALILLDARSHAVTGVVRSASFPPPATHELHVHPQDDAVLLLAACGQDGTFARVAGWSDGPPVAIPTALDAGGISAGFVGFSADHSHVHLVEADELRTHAWPGLEELSSVELADDFVSSYAGAILGDRIFIDGEDAETGEDAVMAFDRTALRGALLSEPVPTGMWAGRLAATTIVTVEAKGEPSRGRVVRLPAPTN